MNQLDKIFVINLKSQPERLQQFYEEIERIGIPLESVERYDAIQAPEGIGCTNSHLNLLKIVKERGYKKVLIFEDDFTFLVDKENLNKKLSYFFNLNVDWRVFMLAFFNKPDETVPYILPDGSVSDVVGITHDCQTASAYIVNDKHIDELINCLEYGLKNLMRTYHHHLYMNDQVWKILQKDNKWFYSLERCGKQRPFYTKEGKYIDYNC
jgi:GR25 family glycosyltransferase involved in LPS biosynthesis